MTSHEMQGKENMKKAHQESEEQSRKEPVKRINAVE